jgi:hypothetical protein
MLRKVVLVLVAIVISAAPGLAGQRPAPAEPKVAPAPAKTEQAKPAPVIEPPPQPVNIRIEVTITDQVGPGEPAKKVVSMIVSDRQRNSIRSSGNIRPNPASSNTRTVTLNVDARPVIMTREGNRISLEFGLEYLPKSANAAGSDAVEPGTSSLNERLVVLLESGKPVMVSQAADPVSDRKITVEVTATILK